MEDFELQEAGVRVSFKSIPLKKYSMVLMDPPWDYKEKNYHQVPLKYPTLTFE